MIAKDVDHGSHDMFPRDVSAGRFLLILPFSGLFATDFALIGGMHAPHEVMLTPMEGLVLSAKLRLFLFHEGYD